MRVITTYDLKPGADVDGFKKFSREVDQPACRAKPVCSRFDVFVSSADGDGSVRVIEDVEVTSLEDWEAATSAPDHAHVMEQWREYAVEDSVVSMPLERI